MYNTVYFLFMYRAIYFHQEPIKFNEDFHVLPTNIT